MKKSVIAIFMITLISILAVHTTCFGETAEGFIDVKVEAPKEFEHSIMINLVDKEGINYIVVAEKENDWKVNSSLPEGEYDVDSVSYEKADPTFQVEYINKLSIKQGVGTAFFITISTIKEQEIDRSETESSSTPAEKVQVKKSFTQNLAGLLLSILKKNILSLMIIIIILVYLYKKRKEKDKEEFE